MDAIHMGMEIDFVYKITPKLSVEGVISFGDWTWNSSKDSLTFKDEKGNLATEDGTATGKVIFASFDATGVHVGDAAQTQLGGSARYEIIKGLYIKSRITFFARNWADFDPVSLSGDDARRESWQLPNYALVDVHMGYSHKVGGMWFKWKASVLNAGNAIYLSDAQNNENRALFIDPQNLNFDAASAGVFYGQGIRFNTSLKIEFGLKKKKKPTEPEN